jgi:phytanoyl-CoA hydroxylase
VLKTDVGRFEAEGYLTVRGLLEPSRDVDPLARAYEALIHALATIYDAELDRPCATNGDDTSTGARFATLLGASGGEALHHLAPVLSVFSPHFRWRGDLPAAQLPELFALMRNERLLDAVEGLIGTEIFASPIYHLNMKLAARHLELAERLAAQSGRRNPSWTLHYGFEVGETPWHTDAIAGLRDSHESRIVVAWIPLTPADQERGTLLVIPGSHRGGVLGGPFADALTRRAITIDAMPGDVVFMDNKLVHGATANRSAGEMRWACNLRYLPIGEPTGRPYLPGFVARSRSAPQTELRNPYVWAAMWRRALENLAAGELPVPNVARTSRADAEAITRRWREVVPDERGWLRLRARPTRRGMSRIGRRAAVALRRWLST